METVFNKINRKKINNINRKKLKNINDISVISSNCYGGIILHDLGQKFNSPFVNLWIKPKDYIKLLTNFQNYMNFDLKFTTEGGINYPVGLLGDIKIYFMHYKSENEALTKWNNRKKRINYDNLFILFTDRDGCTYEDLVKFDSLPYDNKVVFTCKPYEKIKCSFYIKGFENQQSVGHCYKYISPFSGYRYLDQFDYVKWFNQR